MTDGLNKFQQDILPVLMAGLLPALAMIVPKSTVIVLLVVGLNGIVLAYRRGALRDVFPPLLTAIFITALGCMLFKSVATFDGNPTIRLWLRLLPLVLCGFAALWLFRALASRIRQRVHNALVVGTVFGLVLYATAYTATLMGNRDFLGPGHPDPLVHFSSGQMIVAMLSSAVLGILCARRRFLWAAVFSASALVLFIPSSSVIAVVALMAAVAGFLAGKFLPVPFRNAIAGFVVAGVLAIPVGLSSLPADFAESRELKTAVQSVKFAPGLDHSIAHRLQIWLFVTQRAKEFSFGGWGLDVSRSLLGGKILTSVGESRLPLHPHNGVLQVWLEFGVPGVVLLAILVGISATSRRRSRTDNAVMAVSLGTLLSMLVVGGLAFRIWQNWWFSSLWLVAANVATFQTEDGSTSEQIDSDVPT